MSHLITLVASTFFVIFFSACSGNYNKAIDTGKDFLQNMYTCNFKACDALCTDNGRKDVRWFASNLTEDDLAIISPDVEIDVENYENTDSSVSVFYTVNNVIVCDSLEKKGFIGSRPLKIELIREGNAWKVDKLEW
jgi:hypothetical protein